MSCGLTGTTGNDGGRSDWDTDCVKSGALANIVRNSLNAQGWSQYVLRLISVPLSRSSCVLMAAVWSGVALAFMKTDISTPLRHCSVARDTPCLRTSAMPTMVRETATH